MNKKSLILLILFMGICLICPIILISDNRTAYFCTVETDECDMVAVRIHKGLIDEVLRPYYCEGNDTYYYFLPASVSGDRIYGASRNVYVDGEKVDRLTGFEWKDNMEYMLAFGDDCIRACFMRSSDIPTLYISTDTGHMHLVNMDRSYEEKGTLTVMDETGRLSYRGGITLNARGNYTFEGFDKKAYHMTLDDKASLLGMAEDRDWLLLANSCDYSYMGNKLALDMWEGAIADSGAFSPDAEYADVYCNGEYWGLYLLTEKIKVGKNRVDIHNGYLLERDYRVLDEDVPACFVTRDYGTPVRLRSPKDASDDEIENICERVSEMEQAIMADDGYSETGGYYLEYIDLDSWVKFYALKELAYDSDMDQTSMFFYKDNDSIDDRFYMGPVWDFDQAFGGVEEFYSPEVLYVRPGSWLAALYDKSEFREALCRCWDDYYAGYLRDVAPFRIDEWQTLIRDSADMDCMRWSRINGYTLSYKWPAPDGTFVYDYSFDREVDALRSWIGRRTDYLDTIW